MEIEDEMEKKKSERKTQSRRKVQINRGGFSFFLWMSRCLLKSNTEKRKTQKAEKVKREGILESRKCRRNVRN